MDRILPTNNSFFHIASGVYILAILSSRVNCGWRASVLIVLLFFFQRRNFRYALVRWIDRLRLPLSLFLSLFLVNSHQLKVKKANREQGATRVELSLAFLTEHN